MTTIVEVHRKIRRAVEIPLYNAAAAALPPVPIQWKGISFTRTGKTHFISVDIGLGEVVVHEIGPNPMMEGPGYVTCILHSPIGMGQDGNDALLPIVTTAYPYNSNPAFEGVAVHVDKMQHRGYGEDGAWMTSVVTVDWNIYRR